MLAFFTEERKKGSTSGSAGISPARSHSDLKVFLLCVSKRGKPRLQARCLRSQKKRAGLRSKGKLIRC
jgi:hypothetical protein